MKGKNKVGLYKGHVKDIKNKPSLSDLISNNPKVLLAHKKTERLTAAIYMVTDLFDDKESLKWELRKKSIALLSFISSLPESRTFPQEDSIQREISKNLSGMLFPLKIAMHVKLISPMNFSILKEEYLSLVDLLETHVEDSLFKNDFVFPEGFFSYGEISKDYKTKNIEMRDFYKGHKKNGSSKKLKQENIKRGGIDFENLKIKDTSVGHNSKEKDTYIVHTSNQIVLEKDSRRNAIIQLLKTRGELTIRQISSVISGCSEKTIQRELMSLITNSVVLRRGERRWSTYLLNNS